MSANVIKFEEMKVLSPGLVSANVIKFEAMVVNSISLNFEIRGIRLKNPPPHNDRSDPIMGGDSYFGFSRHGPNFFACGAFL